MQTPEESNIQSYISYLDGYFHDISSHLKTPLLKIIVTLSFGIVPFYITIKEFSLFEGFLYYQDELLELLESYDLLILVDTANQNYIINLETFYTLIEDYTIYNHEIITTLPQNYFNALIIHNTIEKQQSIEALLETNPTLYAIAQIYNNYNNMVTHLDKLFYTFQNTITDIINNEWYATIIVTMMSQPIFRIFSLHKGYNRFQQLIYNGLQNINLQNINYAIESMIQQKILITYPSITSPTKQYITYNPNIIYQLQEATKEKEMSLFLLLTYVNHIRKHNNYTFHNHQFFGLYPPLH